MNGRVYDSSIGRFLSADPFIQAPHNSQSYNRYTYVMNNPLNLIDPNGYWSIDLGIVKIGNHGTSNGFITRTLLRNPTLRTIGFVIASYYGGAYGAAGYTAFLTKAGGGSWSDTIKSGAYTLIGAWVAGEVANQFGGHELSYFTAESSSQVAMATMKAVAHGLTQTGIQKLRTGTGRGAFLSGFVTSGFSVGNRGFGGVEARTAIMMVVGGTASEIGGGKFSNGAVTAAFVHLFNAENMGQKISNNVIGAYYEVKGFFQDGTEGFMDFYRGSKHFATNYSNMREANTIGADKYFHCLGNCQATNEGMGGKIAALTISETRETFDYYIKGDSMKSCNADRAANIQGQLGGNCRNGTCSKFRPSYLDSKW